MKDIRIEDIEDLLDLNPLDKDSDLYVNLNEARGGNYIAKELSRNLLKKTQEANTIFLYGSRGCGKSTEINQITKNIEHKYLVVNFSVYKELDILSFNHIDLLILLTEKLFEESENQGIELGNTLLNEVKAWTDEISIEKVNENKKNTDKEKGLGIDIKYCVNFFYKLRQSSKLSNTTKETITQKIDSRISDFISRCNLLIREISLALSSINKEGMLIVIEDLDKIPRNRAENLFFNYHDLFYSLKTNILFTYPTSLIYHSGARSITEGRARYELPMVKINEKNGDNFQTGRDALINIIKKRIGFSCFESEKIIEKSISLSGGCIRDLFRMLTGAANNALNHDRNSINEDDLQRSFNALKREYFQSISETLDEKGQVQVSLDD